MRTRVLSTVALLSALLVTGCAGGWRGAPPAQWTADAASVAAAPAAAAAAPAKKGGSHATADGILFIFKGSATSVNVAGDFNAWSTTADPMKKAEDGSWQLQKALASGRYTYKFVVNGTDWKPDEGVAEGVDDGFGGKNSAITVGTGTPAAVAAAPAAPATPAGAGVAVSADGVTFQYKGTAGSVALAGEFNSWSTTADPLKKQADGLWSITKPLPAGKYMYKFVVDGTNWKEDANAKEFADDGYGGKNSVVIVATGTAIAATAAAAAPAATVAAGGNGVTFRYKGPAGNVALAGEFNSWSTSADPMKLQADGNWTVTKTLPAGKYAYKFVLDGTTWKEDANATEFAEDGYGGKNSIVVVGAGAAAPAAPAAAAVTPAAAATPAGDGTTFRFVGPAGSVNLAGEFNSWSTSADPLKKQADGSWTITKVLPAGKYAYKFVVDGTNWKEDANAKEFVDDGYGGKNSLVVVGSGAAAAAPAAGKPAAAAAKPLAPGAKPRAPQVTAAGVVFTFAGAAKSTVTICGDFNQWAAATDKLTQQADGSWTITRKLAPGTYAYKYLVDGSTWKLDDGNPNARDDDFGSKNSIITVK